MKPREEQFPDKDEPATPKSSRLEEAHQIIEEYAEGLRQIITRYRQPDAPTTSASGLISGFLNTAGQ
jgi:hypothetical protein